MTENATPAVPLTRREARAIERRTGQRAIAGGVAPAAVDLPAAPALSFVHDTAEIERNTATALVSVLPTEVLDRVAAPVADAAVETPASFARPVSIRASRSAALVARGRRRAAAGLGIAATAAALATAAIALPSAQASSQQQADQAAQASLLSAANVGDGTTQTDQIVDAEAAPVAVAPAVAAQESASDRGQYTVTSFEIGELEATPEPVAPTTSTGGSSSSGSSSSTSSTGSSGGGGSYTPTSVGSGDIQAAAQSLIGGGSGWLCTDFTRAAYAAAGISLPGGGVSSQAAGGRQTSEPQVGDLVVFPGEHVGIYAGGNMMWDNPGFNSSYVGWQNVHRPITNVGSNFYFVTYR